MAQGTQHHNLDRSYGDLLGEYFDVVTEISRMLDASGRPDAENLLEYSRLRKQKTRLLGDLERAPPDFETAEIKKVLEDAFEDN